MHKEERTMLELLNEFAAFCKKKNASYYLIDQEVLSAFRQKRFYEAEADICMTLADYLKIKPLLKKKRNRTIESIRSNFNMPGVYYRYVNTETLMYVLKYHNVRHEHGVAINIHILRNTGEDAKKLCRFEAMMDCGIEGMPKCDVTELVKKKKWPWIYKRRMEEMLKKAALHQKDRASMLKLPGLDPIIFPEGFWGKDKTIKIEQYSFKTTVNEEEYLQLRYGKNYESEKIINLRENYQVLVDSEIPYRTVVEKMEAFLQKEPDFWEAHNRYTRFFNQEYTDLLEKEAADWEILFYIEDRIRMWKMYAPQRENIRFFWKEKRKDELFLIFKDYFNLFKKHLKAGRVLYFDEEFWQICCALWKQCGYQEVIEEAQELLRSNLLKEVPEKELAGIYKGREPQEMIRLRKIV